VGNSPHNAFALERLRFAIEAISLRLSPVTIENASTLNVCMLFSDREEARWSSLDIKLAHIGSCLP
jgi:hypothetical protein